MRELTTNELELVSGGTPSCNKDDPPPYGSADPGLSDWLKIYVIVAR